MNANIMRKMGFGRQMEMVSMGLCPRCGKPVNPASFRDAASLREFNITGWCQECQDEYYNSSDDDEGEDYGDIYGEEEQ